MLSELAFVVIGENDLAAQIVLGHNRNPHLA
jgi:hypothetical protein